MCKKEILQPITTVAVKLGNGSYEDGYKLANSSNYLNLTHLQFDGQLCIDCSAKLAVLFHRDISWIRKNTEQGQVPLVVPSSTKQEEKK